MQTDAFSAGGIQLSNTHFYVAHTPTKLDLYQLKNTCTTNVSWLEPSSVGTHF